MNLYDEMIERKCCKILVLKNRVIFRKLIFDLPSIIDKAHESFVTDYNDIIKEDKNETLMSEPERVKERINMWLWNNRELESNIYIEEEDENLDIFKTDDSMEIKNTNYLYKQLRDYYWIKEYRTEKFINVGLTQIALQMINKFEEFKAPIQSNYQGYWNKVELAYDIIVNHIDKGEMYTYFELNDFLNSLNTFRNNIQQIDIQMKERYDSFISKALLDEKSQVDDLKDFQENFFMTAFYRLFSEIKETNIKKFGENVRNKCVFLGYFIQKLEDKDYNSFIEWISINKNGDSIVSLLARSMCNDNLDNLSYDNAVDIIMQLEMNFEFYISDCYNLLKNIKTWVQDYISLILRRITSNTVKAGISFLDNIKSLIIEIRNDKIDISLPYLNCSPIQYESLSSPYQSSFSTKKDKIIFNEIYIDERAKRETFESLRRDIRFCNDNVYKFVLELLKDKNEMRISKYDLNSLYGVTMYLLIVNYSVLSNCPYTILWSDKTISFNKGYIENNIRYSFTGDRDYIIKRKEVINNEC